MTYWPISSPSVFAATKHTNPSRTRVSNDGVANGQDEARCGGLDGGSQLEAEDETSTQGEGVVKEEKAHPLQQRVSGQFVEDDIHGEIIAIRVTRSGHMFATLTRTTLTIWQTKACLWIRAVRPLADTFRSPRLCWLLYCGQSSR